MQTINEETLFDGLNKVKWVEIKKKLKKNITQFREGTFDLDLLTLLRVDSRMGYTETNTIMVNRLKFLVIECCRSKENLNIIDPEAVVIDETKRVVAGLRRAFSELAASSFFSPRPSPAPTPAPEKPAPPKRESRSAGAPP